MSCVKRSVPARVQTQLSSAESWAMGWGCRAGRQLWAGGRAPSSRSRGGPEDEKATMLNL
jgi:hypothetical protein